jgi:hypothetical protein
MTEKGVKYYMKSILLLLVLVLCLGVATSAFSTDSYLCVGSKITGFNYDKNTKVCRSITEESYNIYIVERHKNAKYMWGVRKPGESGINYLCNDDFNEFGYLSCDFGGFRMYKKNLIFLNSYLEDFCYSMDVNGQLTTEAGSNLPYIEIGRCHPL